MWPPTINVIRSLYNDILCSHINKMQLNPVRRDRVKFGLLLSTFVL